MWLELGPGKLKCSPVDLCNCLFLSYFIYVEILVIKLFVVSIQHILNYSYSCYIAITIVCSYWSNSLVFQFSMLNSCPYSACPLLIFLPGCKYIPDIYHTSSCLWKCHTLWSNYAIFTMCYSTEKSLKHFPS